MCSINIPGSHRFFFSFFNICCLQRTIVTNTLLDFSQWFTIISIPSSLQNNNTSAYSKYSARYVQDRQLASLCKKTKIITIKKKKKKYYQDSKYIFKTSWPNQRSKKVYIAWLLVIKNIKNVFLGLETNWDIGVNMCEDCPCVLIITEVYSGLNLECVK